MKKRDPETREDEHGTSGYAKKVYPDGTVKRLKVFVPKKGLDEVKTRDQLIAAIKRHEKGARDAHSSFLAYGTDPDDADLVDRSVKAARKNNQHRKAIKIARKMGITESSYVVWRHSSGNAWAQWNKGEPWSAHVKGENGQQLTTKHNNEKSAIKAAKRLSTREDMKKKPDGVKEEAVNELSRMTTHKYINRATWDLHDTAKNLGAGSADEKLPVLQRKRKNRIAGIGLAVSNLHNRKYGVKEDTVNELSVDTLKSYVKKAKPTAFGYSSVPPKDEHEARKRHNRGRGVYRANNRIEDNTPLEHKPRVHDVRHMSDGEVYDHSQTSSKVKDGDVFHMSRGRAAIMFKAWPTMHHGDTDALHDLERPGKWAARYKKSAEVASSIKEEVNEAALITPFGRINSATHGFVIKRSGGGATTIHYDMMSGGKMKARYSDHPSEEAAKTHLAGHLRKPMVVKEEAVNEGKPKLGSGKRFDALAHKVGSPALAAWIGRRKYGNKKFSELEHHESVSESKDGYDTDRDESVDESFEKRYGHVRAIRKNLSKMTDSSLKRFYRAHNNNGQRNIQRMDNYQDDPHHVEYVDARDALNHGLRSRNAIGRELTRRKIDPGSFRHQDDWVEESKSVNEAHSESELRAAVDHHSNAQIGHTDRALYHLRRAARAVEKNDWKAENEADTMVSGHERAARRHERAAEVARNLLYRVQKPQKLTPMAKPKFTLEGTEVNEISSDLMARYRWRAHKDLQNKADASTPYRSTAGEHSADHFRKIRNRAAGLMKTTPDIVGKKRKEEGAKARADFKSKHGDVGYHTGGSGWKMRHFPGDVESEKKLAALKAGKQKGEKVVMRGRLGKDNPHAHLYSSKGGPLYRRSGQIIKPEHAKHFDVYVRKNHVHEGLISELTGKGKLPGMVDALNHKWHKAESGYRDAFVAHRDARTPARKATTQAIMHAAAKNSSAAGTLASRAGELDNWRRAKENIKSFKSQAKYWKDKHKANEETETLDVRVSRNAKKEGEARKRWLKLTGATTIDTNVDQPPGDGTRIKTNVDEGKINELSSGTLARYVSKAARSAVKRHGQARSYDARAAEVSAKEPKLYSFNKNLSFNRERLSKKRLAGIDLAVKKMSKE